ncbi:hypothetical protein [Consotaella salsifontis]|uniref:Uncharacterized protein n=1 Tax=Consotaella salsifontis TaxID=1365950 RepID=A0A1T4SMS6_9HYPH|nr:hypothetical protein [Consotaella salsifontis]SKA29497.1 hypothetical protein SAMN05428963_11231 [Consotaella salsifontis]
MSASRKPHHSTLGAVSDKAAEWMAAVFLGRSAAIGMPEGIRLEGERRGIVTPAAWPEPGSEIATAIGPIVPNRSAH